MANDRIFLKCNVCGEELFLGKSFFDGFYWENYAKEPIHLEDKLNDFFDEHKYCNGNGSDGDFDIAYEIRDSSKDIEIEELREKLKNIKNKSK